MSDQHKAPKVEAVRYIGHEKTRQYPGGHWLEPGEIISGGSGTVQAFSEMTDFEIVDITLAPPPDELLPVDLEEEDGE